MLDSCIAFTFLLYGKSWEESILQWQINYSCIVVVYAFYQFRFAVSEQRIPTLVFLVFVVFKGIFALGIPLLFFSVVTVLMLATFTPKDKTRIVLFFVGVLVSLSALLKMVTKESDLQCFLENSLRILQDPMWGFLIILSFMLKEKSKYIVSIYALLVLVLFNADYISNNSPINYSMSVSRAIVSSNNVNLNVISNTQVRPLNYVEECIDINTPLAIKMGTSLQIIGNYFCKVILPYPLSFYYGYKFIQPQKITETIPLVSLILHFCLLFISLFFLKKDPPLSFGLFIYLISVIAFSNFLIPLPGMFADRFLLLPSLGWVIVLGIILYKIGNFSIDSPLSWKATAAPAKFIFLTIMIGYSLLTFSRNMDWKNYLTLFRKDINYVSNSSQAHNLLAIRLMKTSFDTNIESEQMALRQEGLQHFKEAVRIYPNFFNANYDLARTYLLLNQPDSAVGFLKKTVELDSNFTDASVILGDLLFQRNRLEEAKSYYEIVVKLQPNLFTGYEKLGVVYYNQKNFAKAIEITKVAVEKMPNNPQPYISLAKIYNAASKRDSTQLWLKKALLIAPGNGEAQSLLDNLKK